MTELAQTSLSGVPPRHHPHVPLVVPAATLGPAGSGLRFPKDPGFLVHGRPLADRFRNRLELALKSGHPEIHALILRDHPQAFRQPWVADVRDTGTGKPALRYLARYVFKSALGPGRLLGYDKAGRILLLCHESGTNRPHVIRLSVDDFLARWLTHVLPKGFVRVRHYGWMSGAARKTRLKVRALVCGQLDEPELLEQPVPRCPLCGAEMRLIIRIDPRGPGNVRPRTTESAPGKPRRTARRGSNPATCRNSLSLSPRSNPQ